MSTDMSNANFTYEISKFYMRNYIVNFRYVKLSIISKLGIELQNIPHDTVNDFV